jgi:hypothetical protein
MRIPRWICEICEQTFTRRWNANRHSNNKHGGILDPIISFKVFASRNSLDLHQNSINLQKPYSLKSNSDIYFQNNLPYNVRQYRSDESMDYFEEEKMLSDSLHEIAAKYKEIEALLIDLPEVYKRNALGSIVTMALASDNTVNFITIMLKAARNPTYVTMLNDAAIFLGVDQNVAKEWLKMLLKHNKRRLGKNRTSI